MIKVGDIVKRVQGRNFPEYDMMIGRTYTVKEITENGRRIRVRLNGLSWKIHYFIKVPSMSKKTNRVNLP